MAHPRTAVPRPRGARAHQDDAQRSARRPDLAPPRRPPRSRGQRCIRRLISSLNRASSVAVVAFQPFGPRIAACDGDSVRGDLDSGSCRVIPAPDSLLPGGRLARLARIMYLSSRAAMTRMISAYKSAKLANTSRGIAARPERGEYLARVWQTSCTSASVLTWQAGPRRGCAGSPGP